MRRSAAPSQINPAKRPKFSVPYKNVNSINVSKSKEADEIPEFNTSNNNQHCVIKNNHIEESHVVKNTSFNKVLKSSVPRCPLTSLQSMPQYPSKPAFKPVRINKQVNNDEPSNIEAKERQYFNVVWCKRSAKKHKKWEGDAILVTCGRSVQLYDVEGKEIGKATGYKKAELESLQEDEKLPIGSREILIMSVLTEEQYLSGKCFSGAGSVTTSTTTEVLPRMKQKPFIDPNKSSKNPVKNENFNPGKGPRHDPLEEGALVMPRPSPEHQLKNNLQNLPIVDVVVDPYLTSQLRPHQREGVLFMYKCVMGFQDYYGNGAILADDMGLGKTLQCITLLWTMIKQGPYGGKPVIKKVLIITPGSLVKNWYAEIKKWLGTERLNIFAVTGNQRVEDYKKSSIHPVLIVSYEMFVRTYEMIQNENFDLVICDEGHRLKNTAIKTTSLIMSLSTRKRIVLTGTPVQNDLQEFFSIVEFCNPGILGTSIAFRRVYEDPIVASRQPSVSQDVVMLGEERGSELSRLTSMFILRRTQEINNQYLPPKVELVLFCKASEFQLQIYRQFLTSRTIRQCLSGSMVGAPHLICIAALKQLCNHPRLVFDKAVQAAGAVDEDGEITESVYSGLSTLYPPHYGDQEIVCEDSGKLIVLASILLAVHHPACREKIVIVSNHTKTLNVIERFCVTTGYQFLRLDGQTPTNHRQELVKKFNNKYSTETVFLLSSKAGGVGLNLIGASRLVLYDIDWNPANDLQAMARVWRDGQKRKVYIYRLLTTGTIEEKVYQRQISKQGLSGAVVDLRAKSDVQFSREDLKDLFSLNEKTICDTHTLLNCTCTGEGDEVEKITPPPPVQRSCQLGQPKSQTKKNLTMDELLDWKHLLGSFPDLDPNWFISDLQDYLTYIFWNETKSNTNL
ncbi:DNA repair and recombination protein RAD54B [Patella vulgata]|uniref:DNA repair and recombination protein RAD54B n=1 Tax=Patella vulgata TaxID=6465 RepID=UPI00217FD733|nr:DNA repair and recombination protein RAD54B [Patella vulgata]